MNSDGTTTSTVATAAPKDSVINTVSFEDHGSFNKRGSKEPTVVLGTHGSEEIIAQFLYAHLVCRWIVLNVRCVDNVSTSIIIT